MIRLAVLREQTLTDTNRVASAALECRSTPGHALRCREHDGSVPTSQTSSSGTGVSSLNSAGLRPRHLSGRVISRRRTNIHAPRGAGVRAEHAAPFTISAGCHPVRQDLDAPDLHVPVVLPNLPSPDPYHDREANGFDLRDAGPPLRIRGDFHHVGR